MCRAQANFIGVEQDYCAEPFRLKALNPYTDARNFLWNRNEKNI